MKKLFKIAQKYDNSNALARAVEALKALYLVHLHNHWESKGPNFYGDHLMFERLYGTAAADLDSLAERVIGTGKDSLVLDQARIAELSNILNECAQLSTPIERALSAEKLCKEALEAAYAAVGRNEGTMGWEDLLPALVTNRETAIYLLGQASKL